MKFKISGHDITFNDPSANSGDWVYIKSQAVSYDRYSVVVNKFEKDFPHIKLLGNDSSNKYEFLTSLVSRNKTLAQWYAGASIAYSELTQLPLYMKDLVTPSEYKGLEDSIKSCNDVIRTAAQDRVKLAEKYRADLRLIDAQETKSLESITSTSKITRIATLTSDNLPLSIGALIEGYTPTSKDRSIVDSRREYGKECLIQYKISLLNVLKTNPEVDIDKVIKEGALK
jgi:hypothetical protein